MKAVKIVNQRNQAPVRIAKSRFGERTSGIIQMGRAEDTKKPVEPVKSESLVVQMPRGSGKWIW
jgi:hypothetical protein